MTEHEWDRKYHIDTCGRDENSASENNYPYEPTPYSVLERLAKSGLITKDTYLLDYGCGKGRVCIALAAMTGCRAKGIDISEKLIDAANRNLAGSHVKDRVSFAIGDAARYEIGNEDTFFFFNPFSEVILKSAVGEILWSWYENPRPMKLFFYYPSDEFITSLMTEEDLCFVDEIDCRDLFDGDNDRERIMIFETIPLDGSSQEHF